MNRWFLWALKFPPNSKPQRDNGWSIYKDCLLKSCNEIQTLLNWVPLTWTRNPQPELCIRITWALINKNIFKGCMLSRLSHVWLFATLWTNPLGSSVLGFSRKEYWSVFLCPPPGDPPEPGIEPESLMSLALAGRFFNTSTTWEAPRNVNVNYWHKQMQSPLGILGGLVLGPHGCSSPFHNIVEYLHITYTHPLTHFVISKLFTVPNTA